VPRDTDRANKSRSKKKTGRCGAERRYMGWQAVIGLHTEGIPNQFGHPAMPTPFPAVAFSFEKTTSHDSSWIRKCRKILKNSTKLVK
jgi:hypothetical protein